jgi:hypothetical protein
LFFVGADPRVCPQNGYIKKGRTHGCAPTNFTLPFIPFPQDFPLDLDHRDKQTFGMNPSREGN